jgi:hypothetical protein
MSKNCVQCHSPIADDAKFCMICGTTQPETTAPAPQQAPVQPQAAPDAPIAPAAPVYGGSSQSTGSTGSTQSGSQTGGSTEYVYPADKKVDAGIACLLSVLFPGVGQMINGQIVKGIVLLVVAVVVGPFTCGIVNVADAIVAGIDAYKCTKALEDGVTLRKWSFFGKP